MTTYISVIGHNLNECLTYSLLGGETCHQSNRGNSFEFFGSLLVLDNLFLLVAVHAENSDCVAFNTERLVANRAEL